MEPYIRPVRGGIQAEGNDFAVVGRTEEEARRRFAEAERLHAEILSRPGRTTPAARDPHRSDWRSSAVSRN